MIGNTERMRRQSAAGRQIGDDRNSGSRSVQRDHLACENDRKPALHVQRMLQRSELEPRVDRAADVPDRAVMLSQKLPQVAHCPSDGATSAASASSGQTRTVVMMA